MGKRGPKPLLQTKVLQRLLRRKTGGMTTGEIRAAFQLPTIQAAQCVVRSLKNKGLVTRDHEIRKVEGPTGSYKRSTVIYMATPGAREGLRP